MNSQQENNTFHLDNVKVFVRVRGDPSPTTTTNNTKPGGRISNTPVTSIYDTQKSPPSTHDEDLRNIAISVDSCTSCELLAPGGTLSSGGTPPPSSTTPPPTPRGGGTTTPPPSNHNHHHYQLQAFNFDKIFWSDAHHAPYRPLKQQMHHLQHRGDSTAAPTTSTSTSRQITASATVDDDRHYTVPHTDQAALFEEIGRPLVQHALQGMNAGILAYGQTGGGKTYSIFGPKGSLGSEHEGLVPRICNALFEEIDQSKGYHHPGAGDSATGHGDPALSTQAFLASIRREDEVKKPSDPPIRGCRVYISLVEIYLEEVYDLLNDRQRLSVRGGTSATNGAFTLPGVHRQLVRSFEDIKKVLKRGEALRTYASTAVNERSSRSHTLFTLEVRTITKSSIVCGKIMLADLAGCEKVKVSRTETGVAFEQSCNINLSILNLSTCIEAVTSRARLMAAQQEKQQQQRDTTTAISTNASTLPPIGEFRNATLTKLLKEYLVGNSKTSVLVTVSGHIKDANMTLQALRFAERAKRLPKTKIHVNTVVDTTNRDRFVGRCVSRSSPSSLSCKEMQHIIRRQTLLEQEAETTSAIVALKDQLGQLQAKVDDLTTRSDAAATSNDGLLDEEAIGRLELMLEELQDYNEILQEMAMLLLPEAAALAAHAKEQSAQVVRLQGLVENTIEEHHATTDSLRTQLREKEVAAICARKEATLAQEELDQAKRCFATALEDRNKSHITDLSALKQLHQEELHRRNKTAKDEVTALTKEIDLEKEKFKRLSSAHREETQALKAKHDEDLDTSREEHERELRGLHDAAERDKQHQQASFTSREAVHRQEVASLRHDIELLKAELEDAKVDAARVVEEEKVTTRREVRKTMEARMKLLQEEFATEKDQATRDAEDRTRHECHVERSRALERAATDHETQRLKDRAAHDAEISRVQRELTVKFHADLSALRQELDQVHQDDLQALRREHDAAVKRLCAKHEEDLERHSQHHRQVVGSNESQREADRRELVAQHQEALQRLRKEHQTELQAAKAEATFSSSIVTAATILIEHKHRIGNIFLDELDATAAAMSSMISTMHDASYRAQFAAVEGATEALRVHHEAEVHDLQVAHERQRIVALETAETHRRAELREMLLLMDCETSARRSLEAHATNKFLMIFEAEQYGYTTLELNKTAAHARRAAGSRSAESVTSFILDMFHARQALLFEEHLFCMAMFHTRQDTTHHLSIHEAVQKERTKHTQLVLDELLKQSVCALTNTFNTFVSTAHTSPQPPSPRTARTIAITESAHRTTTSPQRRHRFETGGSTTTSLPVPDTTVLNGDN